MLCTALHLRDLGDERLYKPTHIHRACTKWVAECSDNWKWLYELVFALNSEFFVRGKKGADHASMAVADVALDIFEREVKHTWGMTAWPQEMPECFQLPVSDEPVSRNIGDAHPTVRAYRNYYRIAKRELKGKPVVWSHREPPPWFNDIDVATNAGIFEEDSWEV